MKQADRSSLLTVNLCCSDNYVGGVGARVLANALQKNSALQELYIKGNDMGNEGIKALCGALSERETSFRVLDAGNNRQAIPAGTKRKHYAFWRLCRDEYYYYIGLPRVPFPAALSLKHLPRVGPTRVFAVPRHFWI